MEVLDSEKKVGIETFFTPYEGVGGKLRTIPKDFIVKEVSIYPSKNNNGKFTIADLTSTNWENNLLIRELSNRLHISRQRVGFAGTKDKRAKTTQLMSFYKVSQDQLSKVKIKDVEIKNIYISDNPIKIGRLFGNKFEILIRNIDQKINLNRVKKISNIITKSGGFPNFYGIQRFGIIRPISHIVGKNIIKNDFKNAVMCYIANPIKGEDEDIYQLRKKLDENRDFSDALNSYPNQLNYEKAILNKLVKNENDFIGALKELPKNLLMMFVYAYQSYLFNKIVSERIRKKIPLNKAIIGDIILPIRKGVIDQNFIRVKDFNIKKVNKQLLKGKAVVSGVLFGSDSFFSEGEMGEIEKKIIENEKIEPRDFIIPDIPFISSFGTRHPIFTSVTDLDFKMIKDDLNKDKKSLLLKFELKKGCYATSLIREFMKAKNIKDY